jgi:hypothetical protein
MVKERLAMKLSLDHLVICADTLAAGSAWVEQVLGVAPEPGGRHVAMGTHNRLLSLGPDIYLEVIAIDPEAPPPGRARWFDLDRAAGAPRLRNWVVKCNDLEAAIRTAPGGIGAVMDLERGDLRWRMAVPQNGCLPFGGAYPGLLRWQGSVHPAERLTDCDCRLRELRITHPDAEALRACLEPVMDLRRIAISTGPDVCFQAEIDTPGGVKVLQ